MNESYNRFKVVAVTKINMKAFINLKKSMMPCACTQSFRSLKGSIAFLLCFSHLCMPQQQAPSLTPNIFETTLQTGVFGKPVASV